MPTTLVGASDTTSQEARTGNGIRVARNKEKEVKKMVILIVDDNESVRKPMSEILSRNGHRILIAENGAVAMKILRGIDFEIDYLITDFNMPEMDGLELLDLLKGYNFTKWIFSATITGSDIQQKALSMGVHRIIWKINIFQILKEEGLI